MRSPTVRSKSESVIVENVWIFHSLALLRSVFGETHNIVDISSQENFSDLKNWSWSLSTLSFGLPGPGRPVDSAMPRNRSAREWLALGRPFSREAGGSRVNGDVPARDHAT
jgi:hypothetical protein